MRAKKEILATVKPTTKTDVTGAYSIFSEKSHNNDCLTRARTHMNVIPISIVVVRWINLHQLTTFINKFTRIDFCLDEILVKRP